MTRNAKPRKAHRPRPLVDTVRHSINSVRVLSAEDVTRQVGIARNALAELGRGHDTATHWASLADAANMAETLAGMGIGGGADAQRVIQQAQAALAAIQGRLQHRSSRALYAAEIDALQWLITLHHLQLQACSYGEFEAAYTSTRERIAQARAGNAPAGAIIVEGEIA